nr:free methionine-r-sulfoxide reductase [Quercus suber]
MVHADASNFAPGVSKIAAYQQVLEQLQSLLDGQRNWRDSVQRNRTASNTANTASLLWHALHALPSPSADVNWAGFYVLDPSKQHQLILGPFQGKVACQTIAFGRGVCGAAASTQKTQLVPNVEEFPGHIACDGDSRSEIVVPIVRGAKTVAIIDIDCAVENGFDADDQRWLEQLAATLAEACDWSERTNAFDPVVVERSTELPTLRLSFIPHIVQHTAHACRPAVSYAVLGQKYPRIVGQKQPHPIFAPRSRRPYPRIHDRTRTIDHFFGPELRGCAGRAGRLTCPELGQFVHSEAMESNDGILPGD